MSLVGRSCRNCREAVKYMWNISSEEDYIKPSQRENSDHYILHVGTNDLCLDRS